MPKDTLGRKFRKIEAKVSWVQRISFIFEIKVLPLIFQKQKNNETAYTKNTG